MTAAFRPTLPGRYRLKLTAGRGRQTRSSQLTVTALPANPLVPIDAVVDGESGPGIRYAGLTYPAPAVGGKPSVIAQVLVLGRQTLQEKSNTSYTDTDAARGVEQAREDGSRCGGAAEANGAR